MPFTAAHPAIVIHTVRSKSSFIFPTALILGTMAPDFEYFLHMKPLSTIGHEPYGFIVMNLPLTLLLYMIWDRVIRRHAIRHLPDTFRKRLHPLEMMADRLCSMKQFILFSLNALMGMATHVMWDSFTHPGGAAVTLIRVLSSPVFGIPIFKYLQHGSTLIGFFWIASILMKLPASTQTSPHVSTKQKVIFIASWLAMSITCTSYLHLLSRHKSLGSSVVILLDGILIGLIITSSLSAIRTTYYRTHMRNDVHR